MSAETEVRGEHSNTTTLKYREGGGGARLDLGKGDEGGGGGNLKLPQPAGPLASGKRTCYSFICYIAHG